MPKDKEPPQEVRQTPGTVKREGSESKEAIDKRTADRETQKNANNTLACARPSKI
jgi:hypothetical protein